MNIHRTLVIGAFYVFCFLTRASANFYEGTITQTITETNDPLFSVGDTFLSWYEYESPMMDGDFGSQMYSEANPDTSLGTLTGNLFAMRQGDLAMGTYSFGNFTHLTVTNGIVTDFFKTGQNGSSDFGFETNTWDYIMFMSSQPQELKTYGTISFGSPVAVPDNSTGTMTLLMFTLPALFARRKRV